MHTTTSSSPTFASIDIAVLLSVQGGCGKKHSCAAPAPATAPAPLAPPRAPRPSIETNVSISYQ
ncbi:MAG TPA: hypothetical protein VNO30_23670 [Kofleriaceae bacterium]|nr:hypothetical protein [Kofleriaceae bacterium]